MHPVHDDRAGVVCRQVIFVGVPVFMIDNLRHKFYVFLRVARSRCRVSEGQGCGYYPDYGLFYKFDYALQNVFSFPGQQIAAPVCDNAL